MATESPREPVGHLGVLERMTRLLDGADFGIGDERLEARGYVADGLTLLLLRNPGDTGDPFPRLHLLPPAATCEEILATATRIGTQRAAEALKDGEQEGEPTLAPGAGEQAIKDYVAMSLRNALRPYAVPPVTGDDPERLG